MTTVLERYEELHPGSRRLHERAAQLFPDGVTHDIRFFPPFPIYVDHAQGAHKWDVDGHRIIDYILGHGALLLGHNNQAVQEAIAWQLERGTHYGASQELEIAWAEQVVELIPSAEVVRFTSSGTEATMMAVRLARAFTGRKKLLRLAQHFHGWNDNVVGAPPPEGIHPRALGIPDETFSNVIVIPQNDPELVRQTLREEEIAAVILEPTGASWGSVPLDPAILPLLREETHGSGALLIFDEVITGFRVSPGGAQAASGITPDLTTMAKILAGGLPGGAVAGRGDIMSLINFSGGSRSDFGGRVPHPGTFNANPLSAAAGSMALNIVATGEPGSMASGLCGSLVRELNNSLSAAAVPGCAYGQASMFHVILGTECPSPIDGFDWDWQGHPGYTMPQMSLDVFWGLRRGMLNEGIDLMGAGGMLSSAHTQEDIDFTVEAFRRTLVQLKEEQLL